MKPGAELVAVLAVVALEPARADAEHEAAVAEVVDGARHVGEQVGVAVRVARDERAERRVLRLDRHRREQRVASKWAASGSP